MILKLVQADLRADRVLILVAAVVSVLLWQGEVGRFEPGASTLGTFIYGQFPFLILVAITELRKLIQKRRRLLAQLPLTATAIGVSRWLTLLAVIAIACLISAVMLALFPPESRWGWSGFAGAGVLLIAGFLCLAAMMRIFWLAFAMRMPANLIVGLVDIWLYVFLWEQAMTFVQGGGPFRVGSVIQWQQALLAAAGTAFLLMAADVLLDRLTDNHLT